MSKQIYNGGIFGGILNIIPDKELSPKDLEHKQYLNSLPRNTWIDVDENGKAISREEASNREEEMLSRFKPIK